MKAFHGTHVDPDTLSELIPSPSGTLGKGVYFTDKEGSAAAYGTYVLQCAVKLENPWRIRLDHESPMAQALDFDHPGLEAISTLFKGDVLIARAQCTDGKFDQALTTKVQALGHDGIIGTYPDGSQEVVAFISGQVIIEGVSVQEEIA